MSQRRELVEDAVRRLDPMRERCARHGISPRVGDRWLARYREQRLAGLEDQSRRPHRARARLDGELADLLLETRVRHPTRGGPKLLAYLARPHQLPRRVRAQQRAQPGIDSPPWES